MSKSTRWCFTLNNYNVDHEDTLKTVPCNYMVYGKETGELGTPHLQGFFTFKGQKRLSGVRKILPTAHWEIAEGTSLQASDYCKKDGDFVEYGKPPSQGSRTDLSGAVDAIKAGQSMTAVADEHPETFVKYHRGLRELKLILDRPYTPEGLRGVWYWGPPGTGKSRKAREDHPESYLKSQNKWWDGYAGEDTVILDDLDTNVLGHYLKIWADRYACTGETKGGTVNLQHDKIIVTSNYSIESLWPEDEEMQKAIRRRFDVTHFNEPL